MTPERIAEPEIWITGSTIFDAAEAIFRMPCCNVPRRFFGSKIDTRNAIEECACCGATFFCRLTLLADGDYQYEGPDYDT